MKRLIPIFLLFLVLMCSCSDDQFDDQFVIAGVVVEYRPDSTSSNVEYVIRTEDGEEYTVVVDDRTRVWSILESLDVQDVLSGRVTDVSVTVEYESKDNESNHASEFEITALWHRDAMRLSDGTALDLMETSSGTIYCLKNGRKLLRVMNNNGPEHVYVGGVESFDDLPEQAKPEVLAHFEAQGTLYDINATLEAAYADYLSTEIFSSYLLSQDISPCASNDAVMYFLTSVHLPISGIIVQEVQIGAAFDRESGAYIPSQELFSCSEEILIEQLLYLAQITDPVLRAEMTAAFDPKYIVFFPEYLSISFPAGTLPSEEHQYIISIKYNEIGLGLILNEWAIPESSE